MEIHSERLAGGEIRFTVKIAKAHFPSHVTTGLAMVTPGTIHGVRDAPMERQEKAIRSTFSVTEKEIANPDFCFVFTESAESMVNGKLVQMPSANFYFVRLKVFAARL
jgi:hypothetical protein